MTFRPVESALFKERKSINWGNNIARKQGAAAELKGTQKLSDSLNEKMTRYLSLFAN